MPGMMDTILNLGLNDQTVKPLAKKTSNMRFAKTVTEDLYKCIATLF